MKTKHWLLAGALVLGGLLLALYLSKYRHVLSLLIDTHRAQQQAHEINQREGYPPVDLPDLPYPPITDEQRPTIDECVENGRKFGPLQGFKPSVDLGGLCHCLNLALGGMEAEAAVPAKSDDEEVQMLRRVNAVQKACEARHGA